MLKTIKARCVNGALAPLEPVDLREGDEYLITFDARPPHPSTITSSVDWALAQIHRQGLATAKKPGMRGAGSRRRGLDLLQSGWAQGVIATARGFWRTAAPATGEISGRIAAGDHRDRPDAGQPSL